MKTTSFAKKNDNFRIICSVVGSQRCAGIKSGWGSFRFGLRQVKYRVYRDETVVLYSVLYLVLSCACIAYLTHYMYIHSVYYTRVKYIPIYIYNSACPRVRVWDTQLKYNELARTWTQYTYKIYIDIILLYLHNIIYGSRRTFCGIIIPQ